MKTIRSEWPMQVSKNAFVLYHAYLAILYKCNFNENQITMLPEYCLELIIVITYTFVYAINYNEATHLEFYFCHRYKSR